jgi:hypothetical protein
VNWSAGATPSAATPTTATSTCRRGARESG